MTIRDYVLRLLTFDRALPQRQGWFDEVLAHPWIGVGRSTAEDVEQDRAERDAELAARSSGL